MRPDFERAAPTRTGDAAPRPPLPHVGKTLLDVIYDGATRNANPRLLNQPSEGGGYTAWSSAAFLKAGEETALGLRAYGLQRGEHAALFMHSDVGFSIADLGCLLAGLVNVPVYLTHTAEAIHYVLEHAAIHALFVSDAAAFERVRAALMGTEVRLVVVAEGPLPPAPEACTLLSLGALRARGRDWHSAEAVQTMRAEVSPADLATILYTSGTTGMPKGVMLTHESIAYNAVTSLDEVGDIKAGPEGDVALSFLPLTHIFARSGYYGLLAYGISMYFCGPEEIAARAQTVRPTMMLAVPRVIEKVYARLLARTAELSGPLRVLGVWAMRLATTYRMGQDDNFERALADLLVFRKWREALGGRLRYGIVGGAALSPALVHFFEGIGIRLLQGYGLTETSPVVTFNRPARNRPGTVGEVLPGVDVALAADGEVLTRGPHVMHGYFRDPAATAEAIDPEGWFHTGDVGELSAEGCLRITDRKKDLFKLSTGKYVMPQPIEQRLAADPLIEQAVVVGAGQKYAAALLFPEEGALRRLAEGLGLGNAALEAMAEAPAVRALVGDLVEAANQGAEPWCVVRRFALVADHLTPENGLLTPTLKVRRAAVRVRFADEIAGLYDAGDLGTELADALARRHSLPS